MIYFVLGGTWNLNAVNQSSSFIASFVFKDKMKNLENLLLHSIPGLTWNFCKVYINKCTLDRSEHRISAE